MTSPTVTQLLKQTFGARTLVVWRSGQPDRPPPGWLNWESVCGTDIHPHPWTPPKGRRGGR